MLNDFPLQHGYWNDQLWTEQFPNPFPYLNQEEASDILRGCAFYFFFKEKPRNKGNITQNLITFYEII